LLGLLPDGWRPRVRRIVAAAELADGPAADPSVSAIIDCDALESDRAALTALDRGWATILVLGARRPAPELLDRADAVLMRDELDPLALRLSLAAARSVVRIVPRSLPLAISAPAVPGAGLPEPAQEVLALLAEGLRDAEIARRLNVSESAVRKLVQRTVQALGARTRAQAVAIVWRAER
jgi:DNA-binding NarL/FixJ family response regulator